MPGKTEEASPAVACGKVFLVGGFVFTTSGAAAAVACVCRAPEVLGVECEDTGFGVFLRLMPGGVFRRPVT